MKRRCSKFAHSAGVIARARDVERWQLHQIHAGVAELDRGRSVPHAAVVTWLRSWGERDERKDHLALQLRAQLVLLTRTRQRLGRDGHGELWRSESRHRVGSR